MNKLKQNIKRLSQCCTKEVAVVAHDIKLAEDFVSGHKDQIISAVHVAEMLPLVGPYIKAVEMFVTEFAQHHPRVLQDVQDVLDDIDNKQVVIQHEKALALSNSFALKDSKLTISKDADPPITGSATLVAHLEGTSSPHSIIATVSLTMKDSNVHVTGTVMNDFSIPVFKGKDLSLRAANIFFKFDRTNKTYDCTISESISLAKTIDSSSASPSDSKEDSLSISFQNETTVENKNTGGFKNLVVQLHIKTEFPSAFHLLSRLVDLNSFSNDKWFQRVKKILDLKFSDATLYVRPFKEETVLEMTLVENDNEDKVAFILCPSTTDGRFVMVLMLVDDSDVEDKKYIATRAGDVNFDWGPFGGQTFNFAQGIHGFNLPNKFSLPKIGKSVRA